MDYLGWELERQRSALAALLLGTEKAQDRESARDGTQWSGAGTPEPYTGSGQLDLGAWETIRAGGQYREDGRAGTAEMPVSAWEAVLGGEAVWAARQNREDGRAGTAETPVSAWEAILSGEAGGPVNSRERAWLRRSGGTGARPEFPQPSVGYAVRRGIRQTEASLATRTQDPPAEIRGDGAGDGAVPLGAASDRVGAAEGTAAVRYSEQFSRNLQDGESKLNTVVRGRTVGGIAPWGGSAALRAEESAKLLSRAVQRDARRYDGGFNIF